MSAPPSPNPSQVDELARIPGLVNQIVSQIHRLVPTAPGAASPDGFQARDIAEAAKPAGSPCEPTTGRGSGAAGEKTPPSSQAGSKIPRAEGVSEHLRRIVVKAILVSELATAVARGAQQPGRFGSSAPPHPRDKI